MNNAIRKKNKCVIFTNAFLVLVLTTTSLWCISGEAQCGHTGCEQVESCFVTESSRKCSTSTVCASPCVIGGAGAKVSLSSPVEQLRRGGAPARQAPDGCNTVAAMRALKTKLRTALGAVSDDLIHCLGAILDVGIRSAQAGVSDMCTYISSGFEIDAPALKKVLEDTERIFGDTLNSSVGTNRIQCMSSHVGQDLSGLNKFMMYCAALGVGVGSVAAPVYAGAIAVDVKAQALALGGLLAILARGGQAAYNSFLSNFAQASRGILDRVQDWTRRPQGLFSGVGPEAPKYITSGPGLPTFIDGTGPKFPFDPRSGDAQFLATRLINRILGQMKAANELPSTGGGRLLDQVAVNFFRRYGNEVQGSLDGLNDVTRRYGNWPFYERGGTVPQIFFRRTAACGERALMGEFIGTQLGLNNVTIGLGNASGTDHAVVIFRGVEEWVVDPVIPERVMRYNDYVVRYNFILYSEHRATQLSRLP